VCRYRKPLTTLRLGQRAVTADGATGSAVTAAIPSPLWSARATATPASRAAAELAPRWEARCESKRYERRQGARRREEGAGPKYELVFTDRLLVTLR